MVVFNGYVIFPVICRYLYGNIMKTLLGGLKIKINGDLAHEISFKGRCSVVFQEKII